MPNTTVPAAATGLPAATPTRMRKGRTMMVPPSSSPARLAELIERERIRAKIEAAVTRLIEALDALDTDPDLEPSLGFYNGSVNQCDLEGDHDGCEPSEDDEPALGWTNHIHQEKAGLGVGLEQNPTYEDEPSLGAPIGTVDQTRWGCGATDDREDANEDGTDLDSGEDDSSEMEPVGAPENVMDQTRWALGNLQVKTLEVFRA